eukprot:12295732-Heterocapsa_arctica.AAC.1
MRHPVPAAVLDGRTAAREALREQRALLTPGWTPRSEAPAASASEALMAVATGDAPRGLAASFRRPTTCGGEDEAMAPRGLAA